MTISMHSASVPVFVRMLGSMLAWLDKAEQHAQARKFDAANYLGLRLAPDMLPLGKQIQIASDAAKGCVSRLAGLEAAFDRCALLPGLALFDRATAVHVARTRLELRLRFALRLRRDMPFEHRVVTITRLPRHEFAVAGFRRSHAAAASAVIAVTGRALLLRLGVEVALVAQRLAACAPAVTGLNPRR